jgi:hypothetical protein
VERPTTQKFPYRITTMQSRRIDWYPQAYTHLNARGLTDPEDSRALNNYNFRIIIGQVHFSGMCLMLGKFFRLKNILAHGIDLAGYRKVFVKKYNARFYYISWIMAPAIVYTMCCSAKISGMSTALDQKYSPAYKEWLDNDTNYYKEKFTKGDKSENNWENEKMDVGDDVQR